MMISIIGNLCKLHMLGQFISDRIFQDSTRRGLQFQKMCGIHLNSCQAGQIFLHLNLGITIYKFLTFSDQSNLLY